MQPKPCFTRFVSLWISASPMRSYKAKFKCEIPLVAVHGAPLRPPLLLMLVWYLPGRFGTSLVAHRCDNTEHWCQRLLCGIYIYYITHSFLLVTCLRMRGGTLRPLCLTDDRVESIYRSQCAPQNMSVPTITRHLNLAR